MKTATILLFCVSVLIMLPLFALGFIAHFLFSGLLAGWRIFENGWDLLLDATADLDKPAKDADGLHQYMTGFTRKD